MVQSKSDTRMKRYGLFNTEAAIAEVEQTNLQMDLKGLPEARRQTEQLISARDADCGCQLARMQLCRSYLV